MNVVLSDSVLSIELCQVSADLECRLVRVIYFWLRSGTTGSCFK